MNPELLDHGDDFEAFLFSSGIASLCGIEEPRRVVERALLFLTVLLTQHTTNGFLVGVTIHDSILALVWSNEE